VLFLESAQILHRFDVVVVGAGIGGLAAATLLAKRGLKVLVVEQHYQPGGACSAMRRQDITFDVGVAMLFGFGERGFNPLRFLFNEIEEEIEVIPHDCLYRMNLMGRKLTFWRDFERFFAELVDFFPGQRDELRALYDYLYGLYDEVISRNPVVVPPTEMPWQEHLRQFVRHPLGILRLLPLMFKNTESILKRFLTDPEVLAFFNMLTCTYCYCDARETPAILAAALFVDNHEGGAFYPSGSPQILADKIEKALEKFGGQVLYGRLVDEILIEGKTARGVRLADGTRIQADRVVSNATVWSLYGGLVRPEHIQPHRLAWAQRFVPTFSSLVLYLGVDARAIPDGTPPIVMFVEDMHQITGHDVTVYVSSLDDPTLCPPGTHSMTVVAPSLITWPRPWEPAYRSEAYQHLKNQEADRLLDQVEQHFPNLRSHIRIMEVGTPSTIERFTLKYRGAVGGPKQMMGQHLNKRLKARSEWKNLYLCGDSTVMGIGIPATAVSGVGAANMILRDLGLKGYVPRPFARSYVKYVRGKPWAPAPSPLLAVTEDSAPAVARDCQRCEKPGCAEACPAGIETHAFARRIEAGNLTGAAHALWERNPLAEVCGYLCPAERFCEKNCNRLKFDQRPVRIRDLHGWVCGHVARAGGRKNRPAPRTGRRVAVVGAGPAGLSCGHYLARLGQEVEIFEKANEPGGIPALAVPLSRLPREVLSREIEGLLLPGMRFHFGQALGRDFAVSDLQGDFGATFLAPGLWSGRVLRVPGLDPSRSLDALEFLLASRGPCRREPGNKVLVIGGGSAASDAALTAKNLGASQVTVVCLEAPGEMPCLRTEVEEMTRKGIRIENRWGPKSASAASRLSFVRCLSVFDRTGGFSPVFDESQSLDLEFDRVILALGQTVEPALAVCLKTEFGTEDRLEVDRETLQVRDHAGVFAGGDIVRGAGTVVEAVADGRRAARGIDVFLRER